MFGKLEFRVISELSKYIYIAIVPQINDFKLNIVTNSKSRKIRPFYFI